MKSPKNKATAPDLSGYPFLTEKGIDLIRIYTTPRTSVGMGRFATYKDYGENYWRIGYGSKKLKGRTLTMMDRASKDEIETQLIEDLKEFSEQVAKYVFVPLNKPKKAAVLSFAHSLGICSFKDCRLLELINEHASKKQIIREWSPYINTMWRSGGERLISRRRVELDQFLSPAKEIPTFVKHNCEVNHCLLNLPETFTGAPNQIKAIEYLERKMNQFDPSGEVLRRFFRYWNEKPSAQASPQRLDQVL